MRATQALSFTFFTTFTSDSSPFLFAWAPAPVRARGGVGPGDEKLVDTAGLKPKEFEMRLPALDGCGEAQNVPSGAMVTQGMSKADVDANKMR